MKTIDKSMDDISTKFTDSTEIFMEVVPSMLDLGTS